MCEGEGVFIESELIGVTETALKGFPEVRNKLVPGEGGRME
jgi:hypothetical protein